MELIDRIRADFPDLDSLPRDCIITGGAVRDALLGLPSNDLDLAASDAVSAATSFAESTGGRRITLGTRFQTERVIAKGAIYDFSPIQGPSIESDLGRRDFTINAIGLALDGRLIDPFDGQTDLAERLVRMVTERNLIDDPLRILRAPRMSGAFGFTIEEDTAATCRRHRNRLDEVAPERITYELQLVLSSLHGRRAAEDLRALGLDEYLFGFELTELDLSSWEILLSNGPDPERRRISVLTSILSERSPTDTERLFDRWLWSRHDVRAVDCSLELLRALDDDDRTLLLIAARVGRAPTERAEKVARARGMDDAPRLGSILAREPSPFRVETLLDGHEIARLTSARAQRIGILKHALWEAQVLGEVRSYEEAVDWLTAADHR